MQAKSVFPLIVAGMFSFTQALAGAADDFRLDSMNFMTKGKSVRIAFAVEKKSPPDTTTGEDGVVRYALTFKSRKGKVLARSTFADVYVWNSGNGNPLKPADIVSRFKFSPQEDLVLLPEEQWERPEGTPVRKIVSLNPKYAWKDTTVRLENERWVDRYLLAGEKTGNCERSIAVFDGRTRQIKTVLEGKNETAYSIENFKRPYLQVCSEPGACPGPDGMDKFKAQCLKVDVRTWKAKEVLP